LDSEGGNGQLKEERLALGAAFADMQGMLATVMGWLAAYQGGDERELYKVGLSSRRILLALGDLIVGWLLQRQAEVALAALARGSESAAERAFYEGKVASARFFAREVLPRLASDRRIVELTTLDLMDLPESSF
jgi:Acetyl-CoA dehydrogenase C-terminal like